MDIQLAQWVMIKGEAQTGRCVTKDIVSSFVPRKGDFISDTAFKDPYEYEVVEVHIDYGQNLCTIHLKMVEIESGDQKIIDDIVDLYKLHNWDTFEMN